MSRAPGAIRPEWVMVGIEIAGGRKRVYASRDVGDKAEFSLPNPGRMDAGDWHLSTSMPRMLIIDRDSYGECLDELMRIWENWARDTRPAIEGRRQLPAGRDLRDTSYITEGLGQEERSGILGAASRKAIEQARAMGASVEHVGDDIVVITLPQERQCTHRAGCPIHPGQDKPHAWDGSESADTDWAEKILTPSPGDGPVIYQQIHDADVPEPVAAMVTRTEYRARCPDDGQCHHECLTGQACFRVLFTGPLSGVFEHDEWPRKIRSEHKRMRKAAGTGHL